MSIEHYKSIKDVVKLLDAIQSIEEGILADLLDKIEIDIYLDYLNNGLPQIGISVSNGATEIFDGRDFSTFQEALIKMAENIKGGCDG